MSTVFLDNQLEYTFFQLAEVLFWGLLVPQTTVPTGFIFRGGQWPPAIHTDSFVFIGLQSSFKDRKNLARADGQWPPL